MGRGFRDFHVTYRMDQDGALNGLTIRTYSKLSAYLEAIKTTIPDLEGRKPYTAWVDSVVQQDGKFKILKTSEDKPY